MPVQNTSSRMAQRHIGEEAGPSSVEPSRPMIDGFNAALARHQVAMPDDNLVVAANQPGQQPGDVLLNGLERLRSAFDQQENAVVERIAPAVVDVDAMIGAQLEVAKYSLLIDVTSKMTGKLSQTLDTLMKGQ